MTDRRTDVVEDDPRGRRKRSACTQSFSEPAAPPLRRVWAADVSACGLKSATI